ncbi:MAG TPA: hypothetical protein VHT97_10790 [Acidimicrobiales bacterium]|nr:hypothetical protein [Acidimicrobiales bacterium]
MTVLAAVVGILLLAGITSAVAVGPPPGAPGKAHAAGSGVSLLTDETTISSPAPVATSTSLSTTTTRPTTSTSVRQVAPTTTVTAARTTPTPAVVRSTNAMYGPGVEIPFTPGQTSWTAVSKGVSITLRTDKATPKAGDVVQFDVELSSSDHVCCGLAISFGDGAQFAQGTAFECPGPQGHGPVSFHTSHIYNLDGRWAFAVAPITGSCSEPNVEAALLGTLEVGPGVSSAQGPSLPTVSVDSTVLPANLQNDPTWVSIAGMIDDADGWLRDVTVNWGDGSPPERVATGFDNLPCNSSLGGWPTPTKKMIFTGDAMHHYATVGLFTVTVTAVSTACDGSMPQVGTGTIVRQT